MEKKKVSVFVAGQRFNIITEEEEKYVRELASHVDAKIASLSISGNMTRESAAVLTALDLADDCEQQKREVAQIREQVKDYLTRIEKLSAENDRLSAELSKAQLSVSALEDARATVAAGDKEREALKKQIYALKEQITVMQNAGYPSTPQEAPVQETAAEEEPVPMPEEPPVPAEEPVDEALPAPAVTAEDDLFFDLPEEEPVKLSRKEKKNRHDHSHVNPYKQQFMQKQGEQKGYTQQRQYSLFDDTNE